MPQLSRNLMCICATKMNGLGSRLMCARAPPKNNGNVKISGKTKIAKKFRDVLGPDVPSRCCRVGFALKSSVKCWVYGGFQIVQARLLSINRDSFLGVGDVILNSGFRPCSRTTWSGNTRRSSGGGVFARRTTRIFITGCKVKWHVLLCRFGQLLPPGFPSIRKTIETSGTFCSQTGMCISKTVVQSQVPDSQPCSYVPSTWWNEEGCSVRDVPALSTAKHFRFVHSARIRL